MTAKEQARAIAIRLNSGAFVGTGLDKDAAMIERAILEARIEELHTIHSEMYAHDEHECAAYLEGTEFVCARLAALRSEKEQLEGPK